MSGGPQSDALRRLARNLRGQRHLPLERARLVGLGRRLLSLVLAAQAQIGNSVIPLSLFPLLTVTPALASPAGTAERAGAEGSPYNQ